MLREEGEDGGFADGGGGGRGRVDFGAVVTFAEVCGGQYLMELVVSIKSKLSPRRTLWY